MQLGWHNSQTHRSAWACLTLDHSKPDFTGIFLRSSSLCNWSGTFGGFQNHHDMARQTNICKLDEEYRTSEIADILVQTLCDQFRFKLPCSFQFQDQQGVFLFLLMKLHA